MCNHHAEVAAKRPSKHEPYAARSTSSVFLLGTQIAGDRWIFQEPVDLLGIVERRIDLVSDFRHELHVDLGRHQAAYVALIAIKCAQQRLALTIDQGPCHEPARKLVDKGLLAADLRVFDVRRICCNWDRFALDVAGWLRLWDDVGPVELGILCSTSE